MNVNKLINNNCTNNNDNIGNNIIELKGKEHQFSAKEVVKMLRILVQIKILY